jgi:hypothetical protein
LYFDYGFAAYVTGYRRCLCVPPLLGTNAVRQHDENSKCHAHEADVEATVSFCSVELRYRAVDSSAEPNGRNTLRR